MADQRNAELHSGAVGFDDFENAAWLPSTYEVIEVLLKHLGVDFNDFLGHDHANTAIKMLRDRRETIKKEVLERVAAAQKLFGGLSTEEKTKRAEQWASTLKDVQLAFGAAILTLVAVGTLSYRSMVVSGESDRRVRHTHEVLESLQVLGCRKILILSFLETMSWDE
jgi:hypothetical protein